MDIICILLQQAYASSGGGYMGIVFIAVIVIGVAVFIGKRNKDHQSTNVDSLTVEPDKALHKCLLGNVLRVIGILAMIGAIIISCKVKDETISVAVIATGVINMAICAGLGKTVDAADKYLRH